ncbi:MAG: hypothetical protein K5905_12135 [Roseibium sp.]|uniref:hypothetical protein n=1 Tax=Roseibium sp. TaxID=1936156 RepID=UPI00260DA48F|nr:hypothetical protein [Roseibium sp.]MCV0426216.1 hypothetical protein [Roseibium sp.]
MHIDDVSQKDQERLIEMLLSLTQKAIVEVFEYRQDEAHDLVAVFRQSLAIAPKGERIFVLHHDPLSLAADLTQKTLDEEKWQNAVTQFNEERSPLLQAPHQLI